MVTLLKPDCQIASNLAISFALLLAGYFNRKIGLLPEVFQPICHPLACQHAKLLATMPLKLWMRFF